MFFLSCISSWEPGSISDWVMIAVTITTAFFLYKTLKSQRDVQRVQNELFRIENIRFKESIKPVFTYSASTDKIFPSGKDKKVLTVEITNKTDNIALNISTEFSSQDTSKQIASPASQLRRDALEKGDEPFLCNFSISENGFLAFVIFTLNYEDISGTKYAQRVMCTYDSEYGVRIESFLPKIILN